MGLVVGSQGCGDTLKRPRVLELPVLDSVGGRDRWGEGRTAVGVVGGVGSRGCAKLHRGFEFYGSGVAFEAL